MRLPASEKAQGSLRLPVKSQENVRLAALGRLAHTGSLEPRGNVPHYTSRGGWGWSETGAVELLPALKDEQKRLKEWRRRGLQQLEDREKAIEASGRKIRSDELKRMEDIRAHIQRQVDVRNKWITDGVATSELPYIRLALAITPATAKPAKSKRKKGAR
jgi:hypothetical protein